MTQEERDNEFISVKSLGDFTVVPEKPFIEVIKSLLAICVELHSTTGSMTWSEIGDDISLQGCRVKLKLEREVDEDEDDF